MSETASTVLVASASATTYAREQRAFACRSYSEYRGIADIDTVSAAQLIMRGHAISRAAVRSGHYLTAGWCYAEAALLPRAELDIDERAALVEDAATNWATAYEREQQATNDIAERALWAICQRPTFHAIACSIETGQIVQEYHDEQEQQFKRFFTYLLDRWAKEDLRGLTSEVLMSYFPHRSNRLRVHEPPLLALPASTREDHHPDPERRVDTNYYNLAAGFKYGVQVKSGRMQPPGKTGKKYRIFFDDAAKVLSLPQTKGSQKRTLRAIVEGTYQSDLDIIALTVRDRMLRQFASRKYIGSKATKRATESRTNL
jgi:hypothetical protein